MKSNEVYEKVTEKLIAAMEAGVVPWARPWKAAQSVHGHVYRGINALILGFEGLQYSSPYWLTYQQAKQLGGHVRKGEKGTPVLLWKPTNRKDKTTGEEVAGFFVTSFTVFNVDQCEGVTLPARLTAEAVVSPIDAAEAIVAGYQGPRISFGGSMACYRPQTDEVNLPPRKAFTSAGAYYSTFFHELVHSTGHASRLGRDGVTNFDRFGSHQYSREELIAEMGAAFLCARAGVENKRTIENSAAYLKNWLGVLRGDRKALVQAASAAQKAVDFIAGAAAQESEAA